MEERNGDSKHTDDDFLLASCLVCDARDGLHSDYKSDPRCLKLYVAYRHWSLNYALFACILIHHALSFFEGIGTRRLHSDPQTNAITTAVEMICLSYYISRIVLSATILPAHRFWHDIKNVIVLIVIFLSFVDIVVFYAAAAEHAFRWSPILRPLFIVNFAENRQIRRAIRNIRNTLPDISNVLVLFFLSVATFSIVGLKLFEQRGIRMVDLPTSLNTTYFDNFPDIFFNLYVLVTTSNNPDIMMPAYNKSRWYALYFVIFLIVNLYLFMNIILAVVYNNYRKHLKEEVKSLVMMKRESLTRAYDTLVDANSQGLAINDFRTLMQQVYTSTSSLSSIAKPLPVCNVLWGILVDERAGVIAKESFLQLAELLNMDVKLVPLQLPSVCLVERFLPGLYNSTPSVWFRKAVASKYFRYLFDLLILINAVLIALEADRRVNRLEWVLLLLFLLEILAKLYTFGFVKFIKKFWNIFDTIVIGAAVILWIVIESKLSAMDNLEQYLDLFLILRILRLWKVIADIERFSVVVKTIQALLPSILTYGGLLFVVFYVYAIIGMQFFRDKIKQSFECSNSTVNCCPANVTGLQYCTINFNTMETSLLYLFDLMVVNQWHVMAKNIEIALGSKWTRLYFLSFHLICVIAVLNIFTAFVLEAFILEYTNVTEGTQSGNDLNAKIKQLGLNTMKRIRESNAGFKDDEVDLVDADHDNIDDRVDGRKARSASVVSMADDYKYRVVFKTQRSVEALLYRMFEDELNDELADASAHGAQ